MKNFLLAASFLAISASFAMAADEPAAVVNFKTNADMPSLKDPKKKDTFTVDLSDSKITTHIVESCTAGRSNITGYFGTARGCEVTGNGNFLNGNKPIPRTQISGGYTVQKDGTTKGGDLMANYLAIGKVPASNMPFGGSMMLKPELNPVAAQAFVDGLLKKVNGDSTQADKRVDTVVLNRLYIPSAGLPSDKGCTWSGNMGFLYQTNTWYLKLNAECDGKQYKFTGNMPWTDSKDAKGQPVDGQTQYDLTLTLGGADDSDDAALTAAPTSDADLTASADGITGQIIMKQSDIVSVKIDGVPTDTPAMVDASGSFSGTNVPLNTVRSLNMLFGLLASTLFGA